MRNRGKTPSWLINLQDKPTRSPVTCCKVNSTELNPKEEEHRRREGSRKTKRKKRKEKGNGDNEKKEHMEKNNKEDERKQEKEEKEQRRRNTRTEKGISAPGLEQRQDEMSGKAIHRIL